MLSLKSHTIKMNTALTRIIIDQHEKGYIEDFFMLDTHRYLWLKNGIEFHLLDFQIEIVVKAFDELTGSYTYVHKIDTVSGIKGLLIAGYPCIPQ